MGIVVPISKIISPQMAIKRSLSDQFSFSPSGSNFTLGPVVTAPIESSTIGLGNGNLANWRGASSLFDFYVSTDFGKSFIKTATFNDSVGSARNAQVCNGDLLISGYTRGIAIIRPPYVFQQNDNRHIASFIKNRPGVVIAANSGTVNSPWFISTNYGASFTALPIAQPIDVQIAFSTFCGNDTAYFGGRVAGALPGLVSTKNGLSFNVDTFPLETGAVSGIFVDDKVKIVAINNGSIYCDSGNGFVKSPQTISGSNSLGILWNGIYYLIGTVNGVMYSLDGLNYSNAVGVSPQYSALLLNFTFPNGVQP